MGDDTAAELRELRGSVERLEGVDDDWWRVSNGRRPLATPQDVAARLGCSEAEAREFILRTKPIRIGRLLRIERRHVDEHLGLPCSPRVSAKRRANGFTTELVGWLREAQRGRCAICPVTLLSTGMARESADHCHTTQKPRGLLCAACNYALGHYEKSQRPAGLVIDVYERYISNPPAAAWKYGR